MVAQLVERASAASVVLGIPPHAQQQHVWSIRNFGNDSSGVENLFAYIY